MKTTLPGNKPMPTITKKELIDRIAEKTQSKRAAVKAVDVSNGQLTIDNGESL